MMQGTIGSSSQFGLSLTEGEPIESWLVSTFEESEREEGDKDKSKALSVGRRMGLFLVGRRAVELVVG